MFKLNQYSDIRKFGLNRSVFQWKDTTGSYLNIPNVVFHKIVSDFLCLRINNSNTLVYFNIYCLPIVVDSNNILNIEHNVSVSLYYIPRGDNTEKFFNGLINGCEIERKSGTLCGHNTAYSKPLDTTHLGQDYIKCISSFARSIIRCNATYRDRNDRIITPMGFE